MDINGPGSRVIFRWRLYSDYLLVSYLDPTEIYCSAPQMAELIQKLGVLLRRRVYVDRIPTFTGFMHYLAVVDTTSPTRDVLGTWITGLL